VIWSGWGALLWLLAWPFTGIGMAIITAGGGRILGVAWTLFVSSVVWFYGRQLNEDGNEHTFFFIPIQYWALPLPTVVVVGGIAGLLGLV
jgi:hypothetical protein